MLKRPPTGALGGVSDDVNDAAVDPVGTHYTKTKPKPKRKQQHELNN